MEDECPEEIDYSKKDIEYSDWLDGYIKWFNTKAGFGFVQIEYKNETQDAFLHISVLKNKEPLPDYTPVKVVVADTDSGLKVVKLKEVINDV